MSGFTFWRRVAGLGLGLGLALGQLSAAETRPEIISNEDCLDCHGEAQVRKVKGKEVPLPAFPTNLFSASVHAKINCVDCHVGIKEAVHDTPLPRPQCAQCHPPQTNHVQAAAEYATSIHGLSHVLGSSASAHCWDCHGAHEIIPTKHPGSPVYKLNLARTCAKCHDNPGLTQEYRMRFPHVADEYQESIHGRALQLKGLIVAPSCNDCHGVHDIKRTVDRSAPINPANVAKTCGKCHVKVEEIYERSVHGQLLAKGDKRAPSCNDCHTAHTIEPPHSGHFKSISDRICGRCHEDRLTHYRDTYHGKAMALGKPNTAPDVAACFDCHGHHDVLPASHPDSRLSASNIVQTCAQCHPGATASFAKYIPHANPMDRENYPVLHAVFVGMTGLLLAVFAFFGAHTLLWLVRSVYLYLTDSKKFREAKIQTQQGDEWFTRFVPFERFLHVLVVSSFLLLVITGMPLKFYYTDWARAMFHVMGGPDVARILHRFGAIITFLYFGLHLADLAWHAWSHRQAVRDPATGRVSWKRLKDVLISPDSMIPTLQDWRDFIAHNRWFFGKGPKPQFDRWTYWERFDYFAVFWGVAIIGMSGLIMWFPQFFSHFMPGWMINVALIVHSDEALLAAGFIFTIHFFNTHFRLEKFPMDTVIFSGRISKTEMLHERRRWYDRLVAEGRLDQFRVKDEWARWQVIARAFGYFFFGTGVVLLLLIIYAMTSRLLH
ncbi:cytochrome c3 family protein [Fontisphaera persica]|uniref:cytochrome c3 family protein n=1 Tax=Fontisphaera persica TaxID=2974023 RepID=UPI0024BF61F7|nr:cytochrome c3 family protein [Fontisphaera persica]WCJ58862.1 cytochrome c3 family protein [Fontisphaera persica]